MLQAMSAGVTAAFAPAMRRTTTALVRIASAETECQGKPVVCGDRADFPAAARPADGLRSLFPGAVPVGTHLAARAVEPRRSMRTRIMLLQRVKQPAKHTGFGPVGRKRRATCNRSRRQIGWRR